MPTFVVTLTTFVHAHGDGTTGILSTPPEPPWIEIDGEKSNLYKFLWDKTSIENHDVKVYFLKKSRFCNLMYLDVFGGTRFKVLTNL